MNIKNPLVAALLMTASAAMAQASAAASSCIPSDGACQNEFMRTQAAPSAAMIFQQMGESGLQGRADKDKVEPPVKKPDADKTTPPLAVGAAATEIGREFFDNQVALGSAAPGRAAPAAISVSNKPETSPNLVAPLRGDYLNRGVQNASDRGAKVAADYKPD